MERALSAEERIRRANEIYQRRSANRDSVRLEARRVYNGQAKEKKPNMSLYKKMILQICICLVIYSIFYLVKNTQYIFSEGFIQKTNEILSYDMDFGQIYQEISNKCNEAYQFITSNNDEDKQNENENQNTNVLSNETNNEDKQSQDENIIQEQTQDTTQEGGVGGGDDTNGEESLSQEEKDAKYIIETASMIKPVNAIVTSRYGARTPTDIISANHKGIDLGAKIGTVIVSAMDGVVSDVTTTGDYGNCVKITSGTITTVYAHCNTIYVNKGDTVTKGQQIAEVGNTGRTTGPHLHFEIKNEDRTVNPDLILDF